MDKSHFRVHMRCEGAGRRASAGAAPDVACQPLVKWLSDTPPGVSLKDEIPHSDTHVAVAGEPRGEGGRVQEDEGEEGVGGEAGGGGEAKAGGAGEGENECEEWWPVQVVSFPDAGEDALHEGAELVSVHVSLWLVPASEEGGGACEGEFEVGSRCIQLPVPAPPAGLTREQVGCFAVHCTVWLVHSFCVSTGVWMLAWVGACRIRVLARWIVSVIICLHACLCMCVCVGGGLGGWLGG